MAARHWRASKVLYAFGHAHLGLTEAPITAEIIAAIAAEKAPAVDVGEFKIERFAYRCISCRTGSS